VKLLRASLPASIELRTRIDPDAPVVFADPTQIHQAIMNLGTNAWYAMKDRAGVVEVTLSAFAANAAFVRARVDLSQGRYALVSVRDTGHGMDQATQDRIFEPFFTTKGPGEGTGLGLATVHGIMKSHDGAIGVESRPGEGTTFHLYFPAIATGAIEERAAETAAPRGRGEHILFVDDEAMLVGWGTRALERLGYRATGATSPADALAAVSANPARFDLVITDLTMPAMNGIQLAQRIREIEPELSCILTTGYSADITAESVQQFGIDALILKPITKQTLGEAVHRVLALTEVHQ
jgi:CheY-like chemotaxis protein